MKKYQMQLIGNDLGILLSLGVKNKHKEAQGIEPYK